LFCYKDHFQNGREDIMPRKLEYNVKTGHFKTENYKSHIKIYHAEEIKQYDKLSKAGQFCYFETTQSSSTLTIIMI